MTTEIYNELISYARELLIKNYASNLSFNEIDLVNGVYSDFGYLNTKDFKKKLLVTLFKEKAQSSILTSRGYESNIEVETKVCAKCHIDLPIMMFNLQNRNGKNYSDSYCIDCRKITNNINAKIYSRRTKALRFLTPAQRKMTDKRNQECNQ